MKLNTDSNISFGFSTEQIDLIDFNFYITKLKR
jgi:hypothetical protein